MYTSFPCQKWYQFVPGALVVKHMYLPVCHMGNAFLWCQYRVRTILSSPHIALLVTHKSYWLVFTKLTLWTPGSQKPFGVSCQWASSTLYLESHCSHFVDLDSTDKKCCVMWVLGTFQNAEKLSHSFLCSTWIKSHRPVACTSQPHVCCYCLWCLDTNIGIPLT